jgi:MFS transporter, DHA1 family, multidrug resistance protein
MQDATKTPKAAGNTVLGMRRGHFIAMMAALMALNAMAIDVLLPAFPYIVDEYSILDPNNVQYVLLSYVVGFGSAQLFFGPISDTYGRRAPLYVGLVMYVAFAVAAVFAPTFELVLVFRFLQGLGAAGTRVISLAVVRDTHSGRNMASTMSLVMMVFMAVPVVAPMLGQLLILSSGWRMIFLFMGLAGVAVLVWCLGFLPESLPAQNRRPLSFASVGRAFGLVLTNRISVFYNLATAFFFGSLFGFLNIAQPLYADVYELGEYFPVAFGATAILMAVSSYANSRLVGQFGQRRLAHGALIAYFALTVVLAFLSWGANPPLWLFLLMVSLIMPLFGLIAANMNSIALEPLGAVAGTASAFLGFTQTVGGAITGAIIGQFNNGTVLTLAIGFAVVSGISLVMIAIAERGRLFGVGTE